MPAARPLGGPEDTRHGKKYTYNYYKCRCVPCTAAHAAGRAAERAASPERRSARDPITGRTTTAASAARSAELLRELGMEGK